MLCCLNYSPMALEKETFKMFQCIFTTGIFALISPSERVWPYVENWKEVVLAKRLWRKDFEKLSIYFFGGGGCIFAIIWRTAWSFIKNQFEFPLPKDALSQATVGRNNPGSSGEDFKKSLIFSIFLSHVFPLGESVKEKLNLLHLMNTSINTLFAWN